MQSNAKSEIRKRISTLRYLFLDFHFHHSIGKSEKGFEKLSLRTVVLHAHAYLAKRRPLFTRIVLQILFRISQSNGKKEIHEIRIWISYLKSTLRMDFSEVESVFGFRVRLGNPDLDFENLNPDFPIERTQRYKIYNNYESTDEVNHNYFIMNSKYNN